MGENLEEKVAALSVCCESCTNRLDKLEKRLAQGVAWIEGEQRRPRRYHRREIEEGPPYDAKWAEKLVKAVFPD